ncbi:hypothetical protein Pcinc_010516 [Petrolisthes cinctipes]|uniref:Uncharacterized protein n=1 Tax=Petrolisthes cinctipes TaxID=88211 RepID=A0AAE1G585_PETCI|nr:hypothetical protein Pcinc_010516 [Petrolisthes cinctipes]
MQFKVTRGQDCPCQYREADPLFPGAEGARWDCQYIQHGLTQIPVSCWDQHPNVTQVFLDYNEIGSVTAGSFERLTNLRTLSLKENAITGIDSEVFADLNLLEFLDMSRNKLVELPSSMWDLTSLTRLYLGDNRLAEVQTYRIENLVNLEVLDLHLNHLSQIPYHSLEPLAQLRHIYLYWNMFTVLPVLSQNLMLEEFLVNGNAVTEFPKYVFGNLTKPMTYHFVDNPAYDVWGTMLLPLPDRSHIMMGSDVSVWVENEQQAQELLQKDWVVQDGLSNIIDLSNLMQICGSFQAQSHSYIPPC